MASYLHPGVYIEELPSGSRPIEGVGTSTACFIGYVVRGPVATPVLISSWDDYVRNFGGLREDNATARGDEMGHAVSAFFMNGGTKAYDRARDRHRQRSGIRRRRCATWPTPPTCSSSKPPTPAPGPTAWWCASLHAHWAAPPASPCRSAAWTAASSWCTRASPILCRSPAPPPRCSA